MKLIDKITKNNINFSKDEWLLELKIKTIIWMVFLSSIIMGTFAFIRLFSGDLLTAAVDMVGALIFIVLIKFLKKDKKYYSTGSLIVLSIATTVVVVGLFSSGHETIRAVWFFVILSLAYYFRDGKEGLKWLYLLLGVLALSYTQNPAPNNLEYALLAINLISLSAILYFYDKIKLSEQQRLSSQNELLEEKVKERTKELEKLNDSLELMVKEEIQKNKTKDRLMAQQSKMALMGEMIGNIAHQFRQPLNAIRTTAGSMSVELEMGLAQEEETKQKLKDIDSFVLHLSDTIEDFRNFFKEDKEKTRFNLADVVEKNLFIVESTIVNNNIKLVKELDNNINVTLLKNELTQSLLNIINNAKDAVVEFVKTDRLIYVSIALEDDIPTITIKDNGGGIPEDVLPKIFEDKFTTKADKDGTGIGLFMTKQMIEHHIGGKIEVSNEEFEYNGNKFKGAVFKVRLPKL